MTTPLITTNPESSLIVDDGTSGDAFSLTNGPPENGFQTSEFVDPSSTIIFANQTEFLVDGGGAKHAVTLDNPNPAAGLENLTFQNLGAGSDVEGGSTSGADITVETLSLGFSGAGDIGDTRALQTQVSNLVVSGAGNVRITNGVSTPTTLNTSVTAAGTVNLTNNGTINATGSGVSGNTGVNITTNGATADLNTGSGAGIGSSGGAVNLMVGEDINLGDAVGVGSVTAATGINLSAGRNVTLNANAIIQNNSSGNISINAGMAGAGGNITMLSSVGNPANNAPEIINNASTGAISLTTGKGGTLTVASTGATGIQSTNGAITLAADAMVIGAAINSGTATTTLEPVTAGQAITLGGTNAPGVFGLTQTELNKVSAATLRIGDIVAGNIAIAAAISNPSGDQIVSLVNNGSISESPFGSLSIPNLRISSTGPVTLGSASNVIATLAANTTGALTVNDNTHILAIGAVDTVTGITTTNSAVNLTADAMNLNDPVNAGMGIVTLSTFSSGQQVILGGGNAQGALGFTDNELGEITAGVLRIDASGNIEMAGAVTTHTGYSTLSLTTNGGMSLASGISVASLALSVGAGFALDNNVSISTLAFFNATTTVGIADSTSLTIGPVDGITSSSNLGTSTVMSVTGNLTFDTELYSAGATTLTVSGSFIDNGNGAFVDVTAPSLALSASTGIGTSGTPLQTGVGALSATTTTGGIFIDNDSAVPGTLNIGVGSTGVQAESGDISIINNGTINSLVSGDTTFGAGNITLKALGANADINFGGQTGGDTILEDGSGLVDVEAGRDLNLGNSAGSGVINSGGPVKLVAGRNLTMDANGQVETDGGITAIAGGNFTMTTSPGTVGDEFFSESGAIALTAGAGATMTLTSSGPDAAFTNGGTITLTADFLNIGKAVSAGSGNVLIRPVTAGEQIGLGSAATGGLTLSNAMLDEIAAKTIAIGNSSAGEVSLGGTITPAAGTNLTINTGSGVVAAGATINLGAGVLTIGFDESGAGATANLSGAAITASAIDVIGGAGADTFISGGSGETFTGNGGADTFEGTAAHLNGDTITDLISGDKIIVTDANIGNFSFQLNGTSLTFNSSTLTLSNAPVGHFAETADPVSGVDLTFVGPPKAVQNGLLLVSPEGESVLTSNLLQYSNAVSSPSQLTYNIVSGPQDGTLLLNGAPTTSFTQAEINSGDLFYEETGPYSATDAFTFTVADNMGDTSAVQTFNIHIAPARIAFQDFNGDGMPDLLYINPTTGDTGYNDGPNTAFHDLGVGPTSYQIVGTGDFAGGATPYILYDNPNSGDIGYNQGPNTAFHDLGVAPTSYQVVGVGDFSGQGTTDILWHDNTTGDTGWNDGPMTPWHDLGAAPASYQVVAIADLNNDGTTDIVWENSTSGDIGWNDGPNTSWHDLGTAPTTYQVVGTANFSSDGLPDLVFENPTSGDIGWNEGPNTTFHDLGTAPTSYDVVGIANLTGNGNVDIVYQNPTSGDIGWNEGPMTPWHDLGTGPIAYKPIGI